MRRDGTFLVPTLNAPIAIAAGGLAAGIRNSWSASPSRSCPRTWRASSSRIARGCASRRRRLGHPLNFHGSLLPELTLMVKYGMTPLEAIRSATSPRRTAWAWAR